MSEEDLKFEEYFQQKLLNDSERMNKLPYTEEQLREIYHQNWEWERKSPKLDLTMEPQPLDYNIVQYYLPEKWEMPRSGKLLYSDEELQRVLKLLIYNLGVKSSLDVIPYAMIEEYIKNNNNG